MFGYVMANGPELTKPQRRRYGAVYCGICRRIREQAGNIARLTLSYDMAFLALLLMSLYEPEETCGDNACCLHPVTKRPWVDNEYIRYAADMNVLLACYNCKDDAADEGKAASKWMGQKLEQYLPALEEKYPRQCAAVRQCLEKLYVLEQENCQSPDEPANVFGLLMAELLVYRQDLWESTLRQLGFALGRYIYLADGAVDYDRDLKKHQYNPFHGIRPTWAQREEYLVLAMGRCTQAFEKLPLVQDKAILDNILYGGVWLEYRRRQGRKAREERK